MSAWSTWCSWLQLNFSIDMLIEWFLSVKCYKDVEIAIRSTPLIKNLFKFSHISSRVFSSISLDLSRFDWWWSPIVGYTITLSQNSVFASLFQVQKLFRTGHMQKLGGTDQKSDILATCFLHYAHSWIVCMDIYFQERMSYIWTDAWMYFAQERTRNCNRVAFASIDSDTHNLHGIMLWHMLRLLITSKPFYSIR